MAKKLSNYDLCTHMLRPKLDLHPAVLRSHATDRLERRAIDFLISGGSRQSSVLD
jgi:hypothetical protein